MDMLDWGEAGAALAALAVVLVPVLLARWLIGRGDDPPADGSEGAPARTGADVSSPRAQRSDCIFFKRS